MAYCTVLLSRLHLTVPIDCGQFVRDMMAAKVGGYLGLVRRGTPDGDGGPDRYQWLTNAGLDFGHPTMSAPATLASGRGPRGAVGKR